jgi:peptidoglycan/xylan/chitin deacetylase (PgdA/CDA1 family)
MALAICNWKHGKQWVYSITYDEALSDLHRFAIPYHEEYGIPGHVEAVAGHIGKVRQLGQSSYNGYHHMGPEELRDLMARGWGVGNHSWAHELIQPHMVEENLRQAKEVLEEATGAPVPLYCAPGSNDNMSEHVLAACRKYGYLGAMSITDALNRPDDELFWLNRTALHDQFYGPFFSEFDPYRNIRHAQADSGWIID